MNKANAKPQAAGSKILNVLEKCPERNFYLLQFTFVIAYIAGNCLSRQKLWQFTGFS